AAFTAPRATSATRCEATKATKRRSDGVKARAEAREALRATATEGGRVSRLPNAHRQPVREAPKAVIPIAASEQEPPVVVARIVRWVGQRAFRLGRFLDEVRRAPCAAVLERKRSTQPAIRRRIMDRFQLRERRQPPVVETGVLERLAVFARLVP